MRLNSDMAFWTYILRCADGRYYTGHTDNLDRRIGEHQAGGYCDFTSRRRPVALVGSEYFQTRLEALEAEKRVKPWSRAKKEALISGDWKALSYFSKPPKERSSVPAAPDQDTSPVRPERSRGTAPPSQPPSTSLGTNGSREIATLRKRTVSPDPSRKREGRIEAPPAGTRE